VEDGTEWRGRVRRLNGAWTDELGEAFLALLRETGNFSASSRALGYPNLFNNRRRWDFAFRRACREAVDEADARLSESDSPFLPPIEVKSDPSGAPPGDPVETPLDPGDLLKPGPKRKSARPQYYIRRGSHGRLQVTLATDENWTAEIEADFLARLRETGNFERSAMAVGFHPESVRYRMRKWAAFARSVDDALAEASITLDYKLVAYAHALLRRPGDAPVEGQELDEDVPFDPVMAMKILGHLDSRRNGRSGRGRHKGPPERTIEEARASIRRKIEAIERHEAWKKEREGGGGDGGSSPPCKGGAGGG
jgi:hypothetical protein